MVDTEYAPEVIISWPIIELQVHAGTKRKGLGDSLAKLSYQRERTCLSFLFLALNNLIVQKSNHFVQVRGGSKIF